MSGRGTFKQWAERYRVAGAYAGATAGLVAFVGLLIGLYRYDHDLTFPLWAVVAVAVLALLAIAAAFLFGRRRPATPTDAARLAGQLEVANRYLAHADDFMSTLREIVSSGDPAAAAERLPRLRELVLDAVVQGVNTQPGEFIRCVLLVPDASDDGTEVLVARASRGHTEGVEHLRLPADGRSIAGLALLSGQPVYIPDAPTDPRVHQPPVAGHHAVITLLCLPMFPFSIRAGAPMGVLSVTSNKRDAFTSADQEFISLCASLIGLFDITGELYPAVDAIRAALTAREQAA